MIRIKNPDEIKRITESCYIVGEVLKVLPRYVTAGNTTRDLAAVAEKVIGRHKGRAAFKGYRGYPASLCVSINEEVVHGIPSFRRKLQEGDIISVDVGVKLEGWFTDSARTFPVGEVDEATRKLLDVTEEALYLALDAAVVGNHVGDIGAAVVARVEGTGYGIIRDLVGHGLGRELHEEPQVPNVGKAGQGPPLLAGMVLAIEPMLGATTDQIRTLDDKWTVISADRGRSAHFEHTIAVTPEGPRVLTGSVPARYRVLPGPVLNR